MELQHPLDALSVDADPLSRDCEHDSSHRCEEKGKRDEEGNCAMNHAEIELGREKKMQKNKCVKARIRGERGREWTNKATISKHTLENRNESIQAAEKTYQDMAYQVKNS